jgi:uncharacterized protein
VVGLAPQRPTGGPAEFLARWAFPLPFVRPVKEGTHTEGMAPMGAQENKQSAQDAYAAFARGDAEGAMRDIDDSIEWTVRGDNALTGTYNGKEEVGELWGKFMSKDFSNDPHDFIAEGDKVIALTSVRLEGESSEGADVLTYNAEGKLVAFDTLGDETVPNRVFAK